MDTAAAASAGTTADAATAPSGRRRHRGPATVLRHPRLDPYWLAAALFLAYATLSVCRYHRLATMSWDLGIFEQAIRAYAHLRAPVADLKGPGFNILGDHFSPITALFAPVYRVFPTPITLLVGQAALFAVSAVPVTRVAAHHLGRARGLAVGVAYGLSWGMQRAVDFDFHEICFGVPLVALALAAVLEQRWYPAMLWSLPLVLVKEDMGATVAAIGLVILLCHRRAGPQQRRRHVPNLALGLIAFGILASALALCVIIPHFSGSGSYGYWNKVDGSGSGVIPWDTALRTLLWVLLPTSGLLALRSPLALAAVPTLGWRFASHDDHYWGIDWHYNAVLMPVVFLALVDALPRAQRSDRPWLRGYAWHLPAAAAAAAAALTTTLPLSGLTHVATYRRPPQAAAAEALLRRIPDGTSVEANVGPISRLTDRCRVFWIGDTQGLDPDYIALAEPEAHTPQQMVAYARQLHPHARYSFVGTAGGYYLLGRTKPPAGSAAGSAAGRAADHATR